MLKETWSYRGRLLAISYAQETLREPIELEIKPTLTSMSGGAEALVFLNCFGSNIFHGTEFLAKNDKCRIIYKAVNVLNKDDTEDSEWSKQEILERDALIMANARKIIKTRKRTSNGRLYCDLFGTGSGTAWERSRKLGLDPDDNITCYNTMMKYLSTNKR